MPGPRSSASWRPEGMKSVLTDIAGSASKCLVEMDRSDHSLFIRSVQLQQEAKNFEPPGGG